MRLFLVRHGQTEWNRLGTVQGHSDISLDDEGHRQAAKLASGFRCDFPISTVYSSDLKRCQETAGPLVKKLGAKLILEPSIREQCFGDWEGVHFLKLKSYRPPTDSDEYIDMRIPNGESARDVWERVGAFATFLKTLKESTVVVSHGRSGALLLARLLNGTAKSALSLRFGNTAIAELERTESGVFALVRYNDSSHLNEFEESGDKDRETR